MISDSVRLKAFHADGSKIMPCAHCALWFILADLTIDHIQPRAHGGTMSMRNTALACGPCNHERGTEDFWEFRRKKRSQALGYEVPLIHLAEEKPIRFSWTIKPRVRRPQKPIEPLKHPFPELPKGFKCGADLTKEAWVKQTENKVQTKQTLDELWWWASKDPGPRDPL